MKNLVGQIVIQSTGDRINGGHNNKQIEVLSEFSDDGKRMYRLRDLSDGRMFTASADKYDELFVGTKMKLLPKGTKGPTIGQKVLL